MTTAIIIEDEIPAGLRLERLLVSKKFQVLVILNSVKNSILWLKENNHPEIIFIDIKLRDGNCFEILDKIDIKSKIVFTTAFNEFALNAFSYNSISYLLKPIDEEKLNMVINKMQNLKIGFQKEISWQNFEQKSFKSSFIVASGITLKKIVLDDIVFFYSENNTTYIFVSNSRNYIINRSLEKLQDELNPNTFFRISRKFIINKNAINSLTYNKQITINTFIDVLFDLIVSKQKTKSFLDWYKK
jgi:two-component system, LytTR family, response regulator LytT